MSSLWKAYGKLQSPFKILVRKDFWHNLQDYFIVSDPLNIQKADTV